MDKIYHIGSRILWLGGRFKMEKCTNRSNNFETVEALRERERERVTLLENKKSDVNKYKVEKAR